MKPEREYELRRGDRAGTLFSLEEIAEMWALIDTIRGEYTEEVLDNYALTSQVADLTKANDQVMQALAIDRAMRDEALAVANSLKKEVKKLGDTWDGLKMKLLD